MQVHKLLTKRMQQEQPIRMPRAAIGQLRALHTSLYCIFWTVYSNAVERAKED